VPCACPVYNNDEGRDVFNGCVNSTCPTGVVTPQFMTNRTICISASKNETIVHFERIDSFACEIGCPGNETCSESRCFIRTIESQHTVIVAGIYY
jgi:hypothetical protein